MFKSRNLRYLITFIVCLSLAGCATFQRKFVRKKKEKEKPETVVAIYDYSEEVEVPVDELYKKQFFFWKTWHTELINRMDTNYKKRSACYDYILKYLIEMQKYLNEAKSQELESLITGIKSIEPGIKNKHLSKTEQNRLTRQIDKLKRQIDKKFAYPKVKDSLKPGG